MNTAIVYGGTGWFNGPTTAAGFYPAAPNSTMAYSSTAGNTITFTFNGSAVEMYCEKKVTTPPHGSFTVQVDALTPETLNTNVAGPTGSTLVYAKLTTLGKHTIKVTVTGNGNLVFDYFKINGTAVQPTPPTGGIIVQPGGDIKSAVEGAASGETVKLLAGNYTSNTVNVPVGVSVVGPGKGQAFIDFTGTHVQQSETGMFQLKSGSRVAGNQTVSGFTIRGKFQANGGVIVDNRKNSWASVQWVTGELDVFNIDGVNIHHNNFKTNRNDKGYGIKALWPDGTITNSKFNDNFFDMAHFSLWNNGGAPNIDIEFHDTHYAGIEILRNRFSTTLSLASARPTKSGRTVVKGNRFTWSSTMHIELVCSDILIEENILTGGAIFTACYSKGKYINQVVNNNDFTSNGSNPGWGGTFYIGADGENMNITNNKIKNLGNYTFIKYAGNPANSVIVESGNTFPPGNPLNTLFDSEEEDSKRNMWVIAFIVVAVVVAAYIVLRKITKNQKIK
jgi:hypothetical protein